MRVTALGVLLVGIVVSPSYAHIIRVPGDYDHIQNAIVASSPGDTVLVGPGTYMENIDFLGKGILVGSWLVATGNPAYVDSTVIEGAGVDPSPIVTFASGEDQSSTLSGFTVRNGQAEEGGGIYCYDTYPTIRNNTIVDNAASTSGGGIFALYGGPVIQYNTIARNSAPDLNFGDGGGIYAQYSVPIIHENEIFENDAGFRGAGIFCEHSDPVITDNIVHDNVVTSYYGGGIASRNCTSSSPATRSSATRAGATAGASSTEFRASSAGAEIGIGWPRGSLSVR